MKLIYGAVLFFLITIAGCTCNPTEKELDEATERLKKEGILSDNSSPKKEVITIDTSKIYGQWILVASNNKETGEALDITADYSQPEEFIKGGIYSAYYGKYNKKFDKFSMSNNTLTILENGKKKIEYTIIELTQDKFVRTLSDKSMSFITYTYERAPDDSHQKIDTTKIYETWVQTKFINKANNAIIEGPVTWLDGQDAVTIYDKTKKYSVGSLKNNSVAGTFKISNNILIMTQTDGKLIYEKILKLTKNEFVYTLTKNPNLIYFNSRK